MTFHEGILLIGGGGVVGSALASRLLEEDREVYLIGRSDRFTGKYNQKMYHIASMDNIAVLNEVLPKCKTVIHLASSTTPGESAFQPSFELTTNLLPSLRLLDILQIYKHLTLIYVSTGGAVYGNCKEDVVNENTQLNPHSYYGAGKAAIEKFIHAYSVQTSSRAIVLRPSNIYGPGQSYKPGFGIIPTIFHHMVEDKVLQLWGDGSIVRDYVYLGDFIECCVKLIDYPKSCFANIFEVFNVGTGIGTSVNSLISMVESLSSRKIKKQYHPKRLVDVEKIIIDSSKISKAIKWNPNTCLNEGLQKTWEWFQKTQ